MLAFLIDQKSRHAALYALICGVLSLFGIIHSVLPSGEVYLPWTISSQLPSTLAMAYLAMSGVFLMVQSRASD